jgi:ADP-heptose:LPS heptosyltransferase
MGDVALTVPVIRAASLSYPDDELIILTQQSFADFFPSSQGLKIITADFGGRHKDLTGIIKLFIDILQQEKIDYVIDLHDVLRTKILRLLFRMKGIPVSVINKGRKEKKALITGKVKVQLKHTVERYADVFLESGYPVEPLGRDLFLFSEKALRKAEDLLGGKQAINIGVAPFARHKLKMWPEENMVVLLNLILKKYNSRIWFFGGREEKEKLESLSSMVEGSRILSGNLTLEEELAVMSRLDFMFSMDSSNMHMAALSGTKVISLWGGTDPLCGFGAWMQPDNFSFRIPVDELTCRPCTVYGKGKCKRHDLACLNWLTPEIVLRKIEDLGIINI